MAKKKSWKPPFVEVEWIDAASHYQIHGDRAVMVAAATLYHRNTAGYLVWQDGEDVPEKWRRTILAHDYDRLQSGTDEPEVGNATVIPTGWVLNIRYLKAKGEKKHGTKQANATGTIEGTGGGGSSSVASGDSEGPGAGSSDR